MKEFNKTKELNKLKLKKNKNIYIKRISIILSCVILIIGIMYFTFAKFESNSNEYTLINGIVKYQNNNCEYDIGQTWDFDYTGDVQEFDVPCNGEYKIETWGAQGGNATSTYIGGFGGYSVGVAKLFKDEDIYIHVGGKGSLAHSPTTALGGYNGGGNGYAIDNRPSVQVLIYMGSGGGATSIAYESAQLSLLEQYKGELFNNSYYVSDKILIVSGGGGGGNYYSPTASRNTKGNSGGGYIGNSDKYINGSRTITTTGGSQIAAGSMTDTSNNYNFVAGFGKGGEWNSWSSGGGGGYYGGGAGYGSATAGGGGSGYIASSFE